MRVAAGLDLVVRIIEIELDQTPPDLDAALDDVVSGLRDAGYLRL